MKNVLSYYYNLEPDNIHQTNKSYRFNIDNDYYVLFETNKNILEIEKIYNLSRYLNSIGIYTHQIIFNNQDSIITNINKSNYILLKSYGRLNKKIELKDIIEFNNMSYGIKYEELKRNNWYEMWINKIDYFEYRIDELKNKYPLVKETFNYFSGYVETAISLLINLQIKSNLCICHDRIKTNYTLYDLYNPFNFIIDNNMRDIAEYFKEKKDFKIIEQYIKNNRFTNEELQLFFIRMLYPTFYFDIYEQIIQNEENIINIDIEEYEELIKKTYTLLKSICPLPEIDWLTR